MKALIIRILRQLKNDPRTLAIMLAAPLLLMVLIYFLLGDSDYKPKIALVRAPAQLANTLTKYAQIEQLDDTLHINEMLIDESVDAVLWPNGAGNFSVRVMENNSKTAQAMQAVQKAMGDRMPFGGIKTESIYGSADESYFSSMANIFLTVLVFFFTFIVSGMALVRERFTNTLERMMMSPVKRWQIVGGYLCGYGIVAVVQAVLIVLLSVYLLNVSVAGSIGLCILIMLLLAICAVETGALVSIFANSEFQVAQFIPIIVVPQIFFTGIVPIDLIPFNLGNLCYVMPMYYGATSLKEIMVKGAGMMEILPWLAGLVAIIVLLFAFNTFSLKRYRRL